MPRGAVRKVVIAVVVAVLAAAVAAAALEWLRRAGSSMRRRREVTPGEREAVWALGETHRLLRRRSAELEEARRDAAELADRLEALQTTLTDTQEQLATARRFLAETTAVANENLRLRGAVDALSAAIAGARGRDAEPASSEEMESLRSEIIDLEAQLKELAEDRDRAVDDAERLRGEMEVETRGGDVDDALQRLRAELERTRTSLEIERRRNLRLGRRSALGPRS
jgi:chromosome segregation ATPase